MSSAVALEISSGGKDRNESSKNAAERPIGERPHDLVEVPLRIDAVQAAGGDETKDGGSALCVGVPAVEHPIFAIMRSSA